MQALESTVEVTLGSQPLMQESSGPPKIETSLHNNGIIIEK
jgi:hypothetical protein